MEKSIKERMESYRFSRVLQRDPLLVSDEVIRPHVSTNNNTIVIQQHRVSVAQLVDQVVR